MLTPKISRRRATKPNLDFGQHYIEQARSHSDPASPPDTPITSAYQAIRKHTVLAQTTHAVMPDARIHPTGVGHQFSYRPFLGPEQLSPRSSSSFEGAQDSADSGDDGDCSSENDHKPCLLATPSARLAVPDALSASDEDEDDISVEYSTTDSEDHRDEGENKELDPGASNYTMPKSPDFRKACKNQIQADYEVTGDEDENEDRRCSDSSEGSEQGFARPTLESPIYATVIDSTTICDFTIEEMDPMESDGGLDVVYPYEIESYSSRSSSILSSRQKGSNDIRELPIRMMQDLKNLNCSNEISDDDEVEKDTEEAFYRRQQHMRRRRVSVTSSIGKRTFSERSESDGSDDGDLDVNEVGSSARRMRKRMHRGSLLFQDPPEPRIDELDEPNSSEDEYLISQHLGMELPYWTIEINEVDD